MVKTTLIIIAGLTVAGSVAAAYIAVESCNPLVTAELGFIESASTPGGTATSVTRYIIRTVEGAEHALDETGFRLVARPDITYYRVQLPINGTFQEATDGRVFSESNGTRVDVAFLDGAPEGILNKGDELRLDDLSAPRFEVFDRVGSYMGGDYPWTRCPFLPKPIADAISQ